MIAGLLILVIESRAGITPRMAGQSIKIEFDPRVLNNFQRAADTLGSGKVKTVLHYSLDQAGKKLSTQFAKSW